MSRGGAGGLPPLWSDEPSRLDLLGFDEVVDSVVRAVLHPEPRPVTVGVEGDWGAGKTSMLELVAARLDGRPRVVVVRTNPWEYDPTLDVRSTLIGQADC